MIGTTGWSAADTGAVTLYLMIDTSASMSAGGKIGRVNGALGELLKLLEGYAEERPELDLRAAVLAFSDGCRWTAERPMAPGALAKCRKDLGAEGFTDMGAAFGALARSLSGSDGGAVIVLLSDGLPTDDWRGALEKLGRDRRFAAASRYAVSLDECSTGVLGEFTGNAGTVVRGTGDLARVLWELIREDLDARTPREIPEEEIPEEETPAGDSTPIWGGGW